MQFSAVATVAVALAAWIVLAMIKDIVTKTANKTSISQGLKSLSFSYYGMQIAHLGMAVMLIGVALTSTFSAEKSVLLSPGQSVELGHYTFQLKARVR